MNFHLSKAALPKILITPRANFAAAAVSDPCLVRRFWRQVNSSLLACFLALVAEGAATATTSYNHSGGNGDRAASVTVTMDLGHYGDPGMMVDGNQATAGFYFTGGLVEDKYIRFDFGYPRVIDEATFYESAGGYTQGVWKWQASNNGSYWTDIGSPFTLGLSGTNVLSQLAGNTGSFRYYQLRGVSGSSSTSPWVFEMEFKIDDATDPNVRTSDTNGNFDILGNVLSLGQWQNDPQTAGFALYFNDSQPSESLPFGESAVNFIQSRQQASWQWAHGTSEPNSIVSMMSLDGTHKLGLFDPAGSGSTPSLLLNPASTGDSQFPGNLVAAGTASKLPNQTLNGNDGSIILTRSLADSLYAASGSGGSMDLSNYYTKTAADALLLDKADKTQLTGLVTSSALATQLGGYYTKTAADALLLDKADKSQLSGLVTTSSFSTYQTGVISALAAKADAATAVTTSALTTQLGDFYTKTAADALLLDKADKSQLTGLVTGSALTTSLNNYYTKTAADALLLDKADAATAVTTSALTTQLGDFYTKTAADARFFVSGTDRYAIGTGAVASQENSQALGVNAHATGANAVATGAGSLASGSNAAAFGVFAEATGTPSLAMGYGTHATGNGASAVGYGSTASGGGSQTFGQSNSAAGFGATAIGFNNIAGSYASLAIGYGNIVPVDDGAQALAMGNGSKVLTYNAMAIGSDCEAAGYGSVAMGFKTKTNAYYQVALGTYNNPRDYSVNFTWQTTDPVLQIGNGADDTHRSNAFEVLKNGDLITYGGLLDKASEPANGQLRGVKTVALGENLLANSFRNVAFGRYNVGGAATTASASEWLDSDPLFELGNGDSTIRRNALTVHKNGETILQHKDFDAGDLAKANVKALQVNGSSTFNGNLVGSGQVNQLPNQTLHDGDGTIILTRSLADSLYATIDNGGTTNLTNYYTKTAADALFTTASSFGTYQTSVTAALAAKADASTAVTTSSFDTYQTSVATALASKADASTAVTTSSFGTYQTSVTAALATKADASTAVTASSFDTYQTSVATALATKADASTAVTTSAFNTYKTSTDASIAAKADAATAVTESELASELDGFYNKADADARFLQADAVFGVGEGLRANSFHAVSLGRYNVGAVDGSATEWVDADPLFELGNGTSDTVRRNALTVRKNGETTLQHKDYDPANPAKDNVPALTVNGSAAVNGKVTVAGSTTIQGILIIAQPAGGIDMGEFTNPGN